MAVILAEDGTKNCAPNRCQMPRWNYVTETICTTAQDICLPEQLLVLRNRFQILVFVSF